MRLASGKIPLFDEAGFLSVREMRQLVSFAAGNNCWVILSGDSRQHHSVGCGAALRIFERSAAVSSGDYIVSQSQFEVPAFLLEMVCALPLIVFARFSLIMPISDVGRALDAPKGESTGRVYLHLDVDVLDAEHGSRPVRWSKL